MMQVGASEEVVAALEIARPACPNSAAIPQECRSSCLEGVYSDEGQAEAEEASSARGVPVLVVVEAGA
jgi:hypothetical protein